MQKKTLVASRHVNKPETRLLSFLCIALSVMYFIIPRNLDVQHDAFSSYLLIFKVLLCVAICLTLHVAFVFFRYYRIIEDTPTAKIRSCAQGYAELIGMQKSLPEQTIISPLSKRKYTWYKFKIEKHVRIENRTSWEVVAQAESNELFLLDDNTGTCIVVPTNAEIKTNESIVWFGDTANLEEVIFSSSGFSENNQYRYTEYFMQPNTYIYAIGMFHTEDKQNYLSSKDLPSDKPFVLSSYKQDDLINKYRLKFFLYVAMFLILVACFPFGKEIILSIARNKNNNHDYTITHPNTTSSAAFEQRLAQNQMSPTQTQNKTDCVALNYRF